MGATNIQPGDEVYLENGNLAILVGAVANEFAVCPVYGDEDSGQHVGSTILVSKIFSAPPVERRHEEVARLDEQIKAKRAEILELNGALRDATSKRAETAERLKEHAALKYIEDTIAGRMTHAVTCSYGSLNLGNVAEVLKDDDRPRQLRLLSLFGSSDGDLQWRVNRYRDDSGDWTDVWLFMSEEDAKAHAAELLASKWKDSGRPEAWVASAQKYGLPVPAGVVHDAATRARAQVELRIKAIDEQMTNARADLAKADAAIARAEGGA